jgi:hypothetical protein
MTPHQAIVQLIGNSFGSGDEWARDVLSAIEAAGYEIVQKPPADLLPEFVTVVSRTATSARGWCDHCDFGSCGWVSPREAFDWAYQHVRERHNNLT